MKSNFLLGARVTRRVFMDDGTWMREGDSCLDHSPLRHGLVIKQTRDEIIVRWDDGGKEEKFLPHGVDLEIGKLNKIAAESSVAESSPAPMK